MIGKPEINLMNPYHKYCYFYAAMKYATLVVSLLIVVAVLVPGRDLPDVHIGGYDKLIHMSMFLVWVLAACYDFGVKVRTRYLLFIAGVLFSVFTEIIQILVEGRSFDLYDMAADIAGLVIGLLIARPVIGLLKPVG